ncbi:GDSL-type esterase/lipase family protein [Bacillus songklensis]|uniref:GDSL-type esterase/lipase family protein n=1 Tax=Bacillus songklensis TaxID=1069116 RepID=A0ABV8B865_9BACI
MKKAVYIAAVICVPGGGLYLFYKPNCYSAFVSVKEYVLDESIEIGKEVRMVAVGDSLSFGIGDTNDNGYLGDVKHLYEKHCECDVVLEDYGVPNDTSKQLLEKLDTKAVKSALAKADYLFVNIGTNDFIQSADRQPNTFHYEKTPFIDKN